MGRRKQREKNQKRNGYAFAIMAEPGRRGQGGFLKIGGRGVFTKSKFTYICRYSNFSKYRFPRRPNQTLQDRKILPSALYPTKRRYFCRAMPSFDIMPQHTNALQGTMPPRQKTKRPSYREPCRNLCHPSHAAHLIKIWEK